MGKIRRNRTVRIPDAKWAMATTRKNALCYGLLLLYYCLNQKTITKHNTRVYVMYLFIWLGCMHALLLGCTRETRFSHSYSPITRLPLFIQPLPLSRLGLDSAVLPSYSCRNLYISARAPYWAALACECCELLSCARAWLAVIWGSFELRNSVLVSKFVQLQCCGTVVGFATSCIWRTCTRVQLAYREYSRFGALFISRCFFNFVMTQSL